MYEVHYVIGNVPNDLNVPVSSKLGKLRVSSLKSTREIIMKNLYKCSSKRLCKKIKTRSLSDIYSLNCKFNIL